MKSLLYLFIMFIATGCAMSHSPAPVLDRAGERLTSDPQGALEQLTEIDISQLDDSAAVARWALLYSEALNLNHLSAPGDTIINIAIDYYGNHGEKEMLQHALRVKSEVPATPIDNPLLTARYLQKIREYSLYRERRAKRDIIAGAVMILLLTITVSGFLYYRLKLRRAEIDGLMAEAMSLRESVKGSDAARQAVGRLFASRFELIDRLCSSYYETQGTKAERSAVYAQVKGEIEAMQNDEKSFAELERIVNDGRDNLLTRLREALPSISPAEYKLAVWLSCGFSNRAIAILSQDKIENIYKRKSRLKAKIRDLAAAEEFNAIFRS